MGNSQQQRFRKIAEDREVSEDIEASHKQIIQYDTDTSLEYFFTNLHMHIVGSEIQNSFWDFKYPILTHKNKLYQAIESYKKDGTMFYSKFLIDNPGVKIKRIGEIHFGENCYTKGRGAYHDGTYFLNFTVYFEKL
jgi:hypothetical protein